MNYYLLVSEDQNCKSQNGIDEIEDKMKINSELLLYCTSNVRQMHKKFSDLPTLIPRSETRDQVDNKIYVFKRALKEAIKNTTQNLSTIDAEKEQRQKKGTSSK